MFVHTQIDEIKSDNKVEIYGKTISFIGLNGLDWILKTTIVNQTMQLFFYCRGINMYDLTQSSFGKFTCELQCAASLGLL